MLFLKTWVSGPTPEEEHEKFNQFRAMTKEQFADDVEEIKRRARKKSRDRYYGTKDPDEAKGKGPDSE